MDRKSYAIALRDILDAHTGTASARLGACLDAVPTQATDIAIVVSPGQDGEGFFSIFVTLGGPDLHVLNKAIRDHFMLFDVRLTPEGLSPRVPRMDSDDSDFVNDEIVDTGLAWIAKLWSGTASGRCSLPAVAFGDDGYGTRGPLTLTS